MVNCFIIHLTLDVEDISAKFCCVLKKIAVQRMFTNLQENIVRIFGLLCTFFIYNICNYKTSIAFQAYLNNIIVLLSLTFIANVIRCEGGNGWPTYDRGQLMPRGSRVAPIICK